MTIKDINDLKIVLAQFAADRDWEKFHSPKNLAMALSAECGELLEHFQWITEDASMNLQEQDIQGIADEIADVFIYLVRLSDKLGIDPLVVAASKIEKNKTRYPADKVKGSAKKYTQYE